MWEMRFTKTFSSIVVSAVAPHSQARNRPSENVREFDHHPVARPSHHNLRERRQQIRIPIDNLITVEREALIDQKPTSNNVCVENVRTGILAGGGDKHVEAIRWLVQDRDVFEKREKLTSIQ